MSGSRPHRHSALRALIREVALMPVPTTLAQAAALFVDKSENPFIRDLPTFSGLPDIDISFGSSGGASRSASTRDTTLDALVIGDSQAGGPLGRAIISRLSSSGYTVSGPIFNNGASGAAVADMVPDAKNMPDLVVAIFGGNDARVSDSISAAETIYSEVTAAGGYLIIVGPPPVTTIKDPTYAGKVFKSSIGPKPAPDTWFTYDSGRYAQRRVEISVALESGMSGRENVAVYGIAARQAPPQGPGSGAEYPDQPDGVHVGPAYAPDLAQDILDGVGIGDITKTIKSKITVDPSSLSAALDLGPGDLSPGITYDKDVVWSSAAVSFLNRMRAQLDPSVKLHVNSVSRTPERQAAAMLRKWQLGGDNEIIEVYGENVARYFLDAPKNVESWTAVVNELRGKGIAFQAGHMTGTGVDIRTNNLSSGEVQALVNAASAAGGSPTVEDNPPHLHVDKFSDAVVPAGESRVGGKLAITPGVGGSIKRVIARVSEHEGKPYSVNRNSDGAGASYGIVQWTQESGNLHDLLKFLHDKHPAEFEAHFGPNWQGLLDYTEKADKNMYEPLSDGTSSSVLWEDPWLSRFKSAGKDPNLADAQLDYAEHYDHHLKGAEYAAEALGIRTERALTLFYDRTINQGAGANEVIVKRVLQKWGGNPPDYDTALRDYAEAALSLVGSKDYNAISRRNKAILEDPELLDTELPPRESSS